MREPGLFIEPCFLCSSQPFCGFGAVALCVMSGGAGHCCGQSPWGGGRSGSEALVGGAIRRSRRMTTPRPWAFIHQPVRRGAHEALTRGMQTQITAHEGAQQCRLDDVKCKFLNATTITWASLHVILVLVGLLIINIGYISRLLGKEIATGLGVSVMAAGVVGIFLFLYVALSEKTRSRLEALSNAGMDAIFNHRSVRIKEEYDTRLKRAKRIDVVGYGLTGR